MTVRHRLAALSALFEYLYGKNAVLHKLVKGVVRRRWKVPKARCRRSATTERERC